MIYWYCTYTRADAKHAKYGIENLEAKNVWKNGVNFPVSQ